MGGLLRAMIYGAQSRTSDVAYADTLNALASAVLTPPPGAMAPRPTPDAWRRPDAPRPSAYQRTIDGINAALTQGRRVRAAAGMPPRP